MIEVLYAVVVHVIFFKMGSLFTRGVVDLTQYRRVHRLGDGAKRLELLYGCLDRVERSFSLLPDAQLPLDLHDGKYDLYNAKGVK